MTEAVAHRHAHSHKPGRPDPLQMPSAFGGRIGAVLVGVVVALGLLYAGSQIAGDLHDVPTPSLLPFILLGVALLIALGFEFVNGFHDTANAVATVIYTHSLPPHVAVVWSGVFNFLGVLVSTGAVAFGIVSLLPVELILQVGSDAGLRHGVRAAHRRDHLEHRHLVFRHCRRRARTR